MAERFPIRTSRFCSLVIVLFLCALASLGMAAGLSPGERVALFDRLRSKQVAMKSLRASVVQSHKSPLLLDEAIIHGTLLFEKPDRFRWESEKPDRKIIVSDGSTMTVYDPEKKTAERYGMEDQFATRMSVDFMLSGSGGTLADLEKRFLVGIAKEGQTAVLMLRPLSVWMKSVIEEITVYHQEGEEVPGRIVVLGRRGDRMETKFSRVTLNPSVPADAFTIKLPPGVRLIDKRGKKELWEGGGE